MTIPIRRALATLIVGILFLPALAFIQRGRDRLMLVDSGTVGLGGSIAFEVTTVRPESAAAKAGLQPSDLILAINGRSIRESDDVHRSILDPLVPRGRSFSLRVKRLNKSTRETDVFNVTIRAE